MELFNHLIDILLHIDKYLDGLVADYGLLIYGVLFLVIFIETGLIVMPFLPGDSLLFATGALVAMDTLSLSLVLALLISAAILGDTLNYWIGRRIGQRAHNLQWVNQQHLYKAQDFYQTYGAKTIVLARFVPIVRSFAPFVAGISHMAYSKFISFNIIGGVAWVLVCGSAGYFFGNIPQVKQHFELVILAIIVISLLPILIELFKARRKSPL